MFTNTLKSLKETFKKGVEFTKSVTVGTITAVKDDIRQEISIVKEFHDFRKSKLSTEDASDEA
jgi:hypothetical protein